MTELVFLKLGGSLITDKSQPYVARLEKLEDLCHQIAQFLETAPGGTQLLVGHGSGSFGHTAARQFGTRSGVSDAAGWRGFAEVHFQAEALNRHVMQALHRSGVPALAFPPSASILARDRQVLSWPVAPLRRALESGLVPVVYGDVIFDEVLGGTIFSTEDLFRHLSAELHPRRILLAGLEPGVWQDFPARTQIIEAISPDSYQAIRSGVGEAMGADVTGGMQSKVEEMLNLVQAVPGLEVIIFSGEQAGNLLLALKGQPPGTKIYL